MSVGAREWAVKVQRRTSVVREFRSRITKICCNRNRPKPFEQNWIVKWISSLNVDEMGQHRGHNGCFKHSNWWGYKCAENRTCMDMRFVSLVWIMKIKQATIIHFLNFENILFLSQIKSQKYRFQRTYTIDSSYVSFHITHFSSSHNRDPLTSNINRLPTTQQHLLFILQTTTS